MSYEDDLEYAKGLVELRDAFIAGELSEDGYIKTINYGDSKHFKYTLSVKPREVFRYCHYGFDYVSSFQEIEGCFMFIHDNKAKQFWINDVGIHVPASEINSSEELHFQNSLVYSDSVVRELLVFGYFMEHPMPEEYQYIRMNMHYIDTMQRILERLREKKHEN